MPTSNGKRFHGLTQEEIFEIASYQNFRCAITNVNFEIRDGVIYDPTMPNGAWFKRVSVDHDHQTNVIRGLLIQKANWLIDQWDLGSYGSLTIPAEILSYKANPPAVQAIGQRIWR